MKEGRKEARTRKASPHCIESCDSTSHERLVPITRHIILYNIIHIYLAIRAVVRVPALIQILGLTLTKLCHKLTHDMTIKSER